MEVRKRECCPAFCALRLSLKLTYSLHSLTHLTSHTSTDELDTDATHLAKNAQHTHAHRHTDTDVRAHAHQPCRQPVDRPTSFCGKDSRRTWQQLTDDPRGWIDR